MLVVATRPRRAAREHAAAGDVPYSFHCHSTALGDLVYKVAVCAIDLFAQTLQLRIIQRLEHTARGAASEVRLGINAEAVKERSRQCRAQHRHANATRDRVFVRKNGIRCGRHIIRTAGRDVAE